MKSSTVVAFLLGVLVLSQACLGSAVRVSLNNRVDISVAVHCKANDGTEVGYQTIPTHGYWEFEIWPNSQRTRYECNFSWAGESHDLSVYDEAWGLSLETYPWAVNKQGPCLHVDNSGTTWKCYYWSQVSIGN